MIDRDSFNVLDLEFFRRTETGIGGDGVFVSQHSGLSAHHEPAESVSRDLQGVDEVVTDVLFIDGVDSLGAVIDVRAKDVAQWTDWQTAETKKLEIRRVEPHHEPGKGAGLGGLSHVRLFVG
jgi:hypothetical protein